MLNFRSKITRGVLGYYFINTGAKKYVNELAKILEVDPGNLDRKLKELESEGILNSEFSGKQRYYFLNPKYPLLAEVKKIYQVKYGLKELLAERLKKLPGLKKSYIFGSYANNKMEKESDIDLLFIGSHSSFQAQKAVLDLQKRFGREFNIVDLTEKEFISRKRKKDEFIRNIFKGKIIKIS